jgi:hypothetical protein
VEPAWPCHAERQRQVADQVPDHQAGDECQRRPKIDPKPPRRHGFSFEPSPTTNVAAMIRFAVTTRGDGGPLKDPSPRGHRDGPVEVPGRPPDAKVAAGRRIDCPERSGVRVLPA